jgi:hypothetical protein
MKQWDSTRLLKKAQTGLEACPTESANCWCYVVGQASRPVLRSSAGLFQQQHASAPSSCEAFR